MRRALHPAIVAAVGLLSATRGDAQQPEVLAAGVRDMAGCVVHQAAVSGTADSVRRTSVDSSRIVPADGSARVVGAPTIILRASASAREVRFASQPQISIRLCGGILDSVRILERRNLPDPVQPGVTYRDVFIAVEVLGHLNAQCLADRLTGTEQRPANCAWLQLRDSAAVRRPP